jgi:hypothetical protein
MAQSINIEGRRVTIDDSFFSLPPDQQNATVDQIAKSSAFQNMPLASGEPATFTEAAKTAVTNFPASALHFVKDIAQPVRHPIDTGESLVNLGRGVMEKLGLTSGDAHVQYADAVGKFLKDRYGSVQAVRNTLANDPVGMAGDLSLLLSGGGGLAAKLPGIAGRAGELTAAAGRAIDPINIATKTATTVAPTIIGEIGTHTGGESLRAAARAGFEGGPAAKALRENMRGTADMTEVVNDARQALGQIRQQRGSEYRAGMAQVGRNQTVLPFTDIDTAINSMAQVKNYKGQNLSPKTDAIWREMTDTIWEWRQLDPREFHTPEGMDALKQKLGNIRDATAYGTPERKVANDIYGAVRNTIVKQAPEYAKVMEGYEQASDLIKQMERTLSINPAATIDTTLRKLQSVLRNNVNTNYGQRAKLVEYLVNSGAPHLMEKLAGQALSSWAPRGLGKLAATESGAAALGALGGGVSGAALGTLASLPLMSPRAMGEAFYLGGRAAKPASYVTTPYGIGANALRAGGVDALSQTNDALAP